MQPSDAAMALFLEPVRSRPRAELLDEARPTPDPDLPRQGWIAPPDLRACLAEAYPVSGSRRPRSTHRRAGRLGSTRKDFPA